MAIDKSESANFTKQEMFDILCDERRLCILYYNKYFEILCKELESLSPDNLPVVLEKINEIKEKAQRTMEESFLWPYWENDPD